MEATTAHRIDKSRIDKNAVVAAHQQVSEISRETANEEAHA